MEALKFKRYEGFGKSVCEESYITSNKGYSLHKVEWMPECPPQAIVMVIHDIGDHTLRYSQLAEYLNYQKIGVLGIDLRGHGKSDGMRGSANYNDYLDNVVDLIKLTQKLHPQTPKVLYGNGLGANLALFCTLRQKSTIQGLIMSSPWLRSYYRFPVFKKISSSVLAKFVPFWTVQNSLNNKNLTHDLAVYKRYEEDVLVHHRISPRLIKEANHAGMALLKNRHKCNFPLLLMHGTSDKVTSWRASAEFTHYTSDNTTLKLWENHYHELHNEFDKEEIFDYILQWINNLSTAKRVIYGNF